MNLTAVFGGRYALGPHPVLGKGTYGKVVQTKCGRAVKYVKWYNDEDDRFKLREIQALEDCRHPNVVMLLDYEYFKGSLYLVMECWTTTLAIRLQHAAMTLPQANWVLLHILRGLAHMHECGYLHRDLKPDNILLRNNSLDPKVAELCLTDLGLATTFPPRSEVVTMPTDPTQTAHVFTRWYRPPEVTLMLPYDESADMFSVGCIFVEVVRQTLRETPRALCHESASCYPFSATYLKDGEHIHTLYKVLGTPTPEERALWVAPEEDTPANAIARAELLAYADDLPRYERRELGFPEAQTQWLHAMLTFDPAARECAAALRDIIGGISFC